MSTSRAYRWERISGETRHQRDPALAILRAAADDALRSRADRLLARHPWGGFDADDDLTERLTNAR